MFSNTNKAGKERRTHTKVIGIETGAFTQTQTERHSWANRVKIKSQATPEIPTDSKGWRARVLEAILANI